MARTMSDRDRAIPLLAEVFREHGYEGASLSVLSSATGLGKGSLYNFFPGGKDEMAAAVLADIDGWFEANIFAPLRGTRADGAEEGLDRMFEAVVDYFRSGRRVCLQGAFALGSERDRFGKAVRGYFERWVTALGEALRASGRTDSAARADAVETVSRIQGAIVLSRALDDQTLFGRLVARARAALSVDPGAADVTTGQSTTSTSFQNAT
jgi:TetR/AcrR family transcriptional repressor of lmrAB and yxaGH operons